jgi:hypothetical protein
MNSKLKRQSARLLEHLACVKKRSDGEFVKGSSMHTSLLAFVSGWYDSLKGVLMPSKDPTMRRIHARAAAHALHSFYDSREITRAARTTFMARFMESVDPLGELRRTDPSQAERRANSAVRAHFQLMAAKSVLARTRNKSE